MSVRRAWVILSALSLILLMQNTDLSPAPPLADSAAVNDGMTPGNGFQSGWTEITAPVHPPGVAGSMMTYDPEEGVFVLFGGSVGHPINETWIFDPGTLAWMEVRPSVSPPARADGMLVYDRAARAIVLFGGWYETPGDNYKRWNDTWAFYVVNRTWIERHPSSSPPPRSDAAVAYDDNEGTILLFGGFDGSTYLGDVWSYSFENNTWVSRSSGRMPSPRADGRMVYDPQGRDFFLFSGNDYSDPSFKFHHLADMWRYRWIENSWTQIFPDTLPMPRTYAVFDHDPMFGELLMTGGYGNRTVLGDIWSFNTTRLVWRNITTPGGPSPRIAAVGGFDPVRGILVLFGGGDDSSVKSDTWVFRYPPPLVGDIFISNPTPIAGDPIHFVSDVRGGSGSMREVAWDFGDGQTASGPSVVHAFAAPGLYSIRFRAQDERGAELDRTMNISVGFLFQFWLDISLMGLLVTGTFASVMLMIRWYRRRNSSS